MWLTEYDGSGNTKRRINLSWVQFAEKVCDCIDDDKYITDKPSEAKEIPFKAFYADNKENICEIKDYEFASQTDNFMPLDFKEEKNIYIGIDENYFEKLPQNIAYVFKCSNVKDVSKYYVYFMFFHKDMYNPHLESMKAKDYEKSISKHKQPLEKWKFYLTLGKEKNKTCDESNY